TQYQQPADTNDIYNCTYNICLLHTVCTTAGFWGGGGGGPVSDRILELISTEKKSNISTEFIYYDGRLSDQQMALLQYQRENIHYLSEEVLRLQECLSKYQRTDVGNTPQVDLVHLLASRDQELRALSAEMNQVHSELQLARGLIDEKDSEIQRIRLSNSQYVEENDRLRAILGEWSSRAAKLERALEAERLSNIELRKNIAKFRGQLHKDWLATLHLPTVSPRTT
uniref:Uncharacterized protein n=1 Tax=Aegilops tauschii subsp. strangulata TaxID=200361 RepID=A0A453PS42_AEGTS